MSNQGGDRLPKNENTDKHGEGDLKGQRAVTDKLHEQVTGATQRADISAMHNLAASESKLHSVRVGADHSDDSKTQPTFSQRDGMALASLETALVRTAEQKKQHEKNPSTAPDIQKSGMVIRNWLTEGVDCRKLYDDLVNLIPGNPDQKIVKDLGIEAVPAADLKNSNETTSKVDHALANARLDPKHYNCNDYVKMFVLAGEKGPALDTYIHQRNGPAMTGSPEKFLKEHKYQPIECGPIKQGDIIVVNGPAGEHSAVVCKDHVTHQLYTMQKPNPTDVPVRLSLDQFCRVEKVNEASVEVYRKT